MPVIEAPRSLPTNGYTTDLGSLACARCDGETGSIWIELSQFSPRGYECVPLCLDCALLVVEQFECAEAA